jgi:hypothetical protein
VEDLRSERYSIRTVIDGAKSSRDFEAARPTNSSATIAVAFYAVGEIAASLYEASCHCWECNCHNREADRKLMVRLDHRIHSKPGRGQNVPPDPITFGLCLSIEETVLQDIKITACPAERLDVQRKTRVKWQTGSVVPVTLIAEKVGLICSGY